MEAKLSQDDSSARNVPRLEGRSMFTFNRTGVLTSIVALAALCDFLYFLPLLGDVSKEARLLSLVLSITAGCMVTYRFVKGWRTSGNVILMVIWMLIVFVWLYGFSPRHLAVYLGLGAVMFLRDDQRKLAFEKFKLIFCMIVLVNSLAYPLASFGALHSFGEIIPDHWLKQEVGMFYENLGITFVLHGMLNSIDVGNFMLYRMSAWFEEPGNVGTIAALLLAASDFRMDWKGKVLLVGGGLSFSLAFFVMVLIYTVLKKPRMFIYLLGAFIFLTWYFQDNEFVSAKIVDRISALDQGVLVDNRTGGDFDREFSKFVATPSVWFGHDSERQLDKLHYNASSWKNLVWDYGVIGTALFLSVFMFVFIDYLGPNLKNALLRSKELLPFFLVFMLNIYQRPYVLIVSFFLVFAGGLATVIRNAEMRRELRSGGVGEF